MAGQKGREETSAIKASRRVIIAKKLIKQTNILFSLTMEGLRYIRIADIAGYNLDYATESLDIAQRRLLELNSVEYNGNIPRETLLDIHLTTDDIYLLEKRIGQLLDQQLDDYHSRQTITWNKVEACKKLRQLVDKDMIRISAVDLFQYVSSSIVYVSYDEARFNILRTLGASLERSGNVTSVRWSEIMNQPPSY